MNSPEVEGIIRDNIEFGTRHRLDLKGGGYGGLRVFYAFKRGGVYYIQDYTSERTNTMKYLMTEKLDVLIKTMKEYAALDNWRAVEESFYTEGMTRGN